MNILVDTSVWINFFSPKPSVDVSGVELLIEEKRCMTCLPVRAEVLSGEISPQNRLTVLRALDSLFYIDSDWNSMLSWNAVAEMAQQARLKRVGMPGLVDRMILFCVKKSGVGLWTYDRRLKRLALMNRIPLFS